MITMKKTSIFLSGLLLLLSLTACSNSKENEPYSLGNSSPISENSSVSVTSNRSSGSSDSMEKTPEPSTQSGTGSDSSMESGSTSTTPQQSSGSSDSMEKMPEPSTQSGTGSDSSTESGSTSTTPQQSSDTSDTKPDQIQSTITPSKPEENPHTSDGKENSEYMMNIKIGDNLLTAALEENSSAKALLELLKNGSVTVHMSDYAGMEKVGTLPESLPRNDEHIDTDACDLILYQGNQFVIYYGTNSWSLTRLGKITNKTKSELKKILGTGDVTAVLSLP